MSVPATGHVRGVEADVSFIRLHWPGLAFVSLLCFAMLTAACRTSDEYYRQNIVRTDSSYALLNVGILLQGTHDYSWPYILHHPVPFHSSDHWTDVYVLPSLSAWALRHVLPQRPAVAVYLNGIWLFAMGISVYVLFQRVVQSCALAAVLAGNLILSNPYLASPFYGLTSLDPNLPAFLIGTSALSWMLMTGGFQNRLASVLFGFFMSMLLLGRVYTAALLAPVILLYIGLSLWRSRASGSLRETGVNVLAAAAVILALSAWWLFPHLQTVMEYPYQFKAAGVLRRINLLEALQLWAKFLGSLVTGNSLVVAALLWATGRRMLSAERSLANPHLWLYMAFALGPLLVLAYLRTAFLPYGMVALLGVYLALLPTGEVWESAPVMRRGVLAIVAVAVCISAYSFFNTLTGAHRLAPLPKRAVVTAVDAVRRDAAMYGLRRATVGLVHWGTMHDASLLNVLIYDAGIRVETPEYSVPAGDKALTVKPLVTDLWRWDSQVHSAGALSPQNWADRLVADADYVIIPTGDAAQHARAGHWPDWLAASRLIKHSGVFRAITGSLLIPNDGPVQVWARNSRIPQGANHRSGD